MMGNPQRADGANACPLTDAPTQSDNSRARHRLVLLQSLAASVQGLNRDPANRHRLQSSDPSSAVTARAAANIAAWREYLPEACITAMINDGWHWST